MPYHSLLFTYLCTLVCRPQQALHVLSPSTGSAAHTLAAVDSGATPTPPAAAAGQVGSHAHETSTGEESMAVGGWAEHVFKNQDIFLIM